MVQVSPFNVEIVVSQCRCSKVSIRTFARAKLIPGKITKFLKKPSKNIREGNPESSVRVNLHFPNNASLIGVDELTAIVKRSGATHWVVVGEPKVHVLKGLPDQQLHDGQEINLMLQPDN